MYLYERSRLNVSAGGTAFLIPDNGRAGSALLSRSGRRCIAFCVDESELRLAVEDDGIGVDSTARRKSFYASCSPPVRDRRALVYRRRRVTDPARTREVRRYVRRALHLPGRGHKLAVLAQSA